MPVLFAYTPFLYGDWTDAVIVRPGAVPGTYLTPDGPRPFTVHTESIAVKGASPVVLEIRETVWGPVLDDKPDPVQDIAVSWV